MRRKGAAGVRILITGALQVLMEDRRDGEGRGGERDGRKGGRDEAKRRK